MGEVSEDDLGKFGVFAIKDYDSRQWRTSGCSSWTKEVRTIKKNRVTRVRIDGDTQEFILTMDQKGKVVTDRSQGKSSQTAGEEHREALEVRVSKADLEGYFGILVTRQFYATDWTRDYAKKAKKRMLKVGDTVTSVEDRSGAGATGADAITILTDGLKDSDDDW